MHRPVQIAIRLRPPRFNNDQVCISPSSSSSTIQHNKVFVLDKNGILSNKGSASRIEFPVDFCFKEEQQQQQQGEHGLENDSNVNQTSKQESFSQQMLTQLFTVASAESKNNNDQNHSNINDQKSSSIAKKYLLDDIAQKETVCVFAAGATAHGKTFTLLGKRDAPQHQKLQKTASTKKELMSSEAINKKGLVQATVASLLSHNVHNQNPTKQRNDPHHLLPKIEVKLLVSIIEIYTDQCFDLLDNSKKKKVRERAVVVSPINNSNNNSQQQSPTNHNNNNNNNVTYDNRVYVENLHRIEVSSIAQWNEIIEPVLDLRRTSATEKNDRSSRSHAIIFLQTLIHSSFYDADGLSDLDSRKKNGSNTTSTSKIATKGLEFCFVDLAGSERPPTTSYGPALSKESISINKSLTALASTIHILSQQQMQVGSSSSSLPSPSSASSTSSASHQQQHHQQSPSSSIATTPTNQNNPALRESVLTWLLQRFLQGTSFTTFIGCIDSGEKSLAESVQTLRYVSRLRGLQTMCHIPSTNLLKRKVSKNKNNNNKVENDGNESNDDEVEFEYYFDEDNGDDKNRHKGKNAADREEILKRQITKDLMEKRKQMMKQFSLMSQSPMKNDDGSHTPNSQKQNQENNHNNNYNVLSPSKEEVDNLKKDLESYRDLASQVQDQQKKRIEELQKRIEELELGKEKAKHQVVVVDGEETEKRKTTPPQSKKKSPSPSTRLHQELHNPLDAISLLLHTRVKNIVVDEKEKKILDDVETTSDGEENEDDDDDDATTSSSTSSNKQVSHQKQQQISPIHNNNSNNRSATSTTTSSSALIFSPVSLISAKQQKKYLKYDEYAILAAQNGSNAANNISALSSGNCDASSITARTTTTANSSAIHNNNNNNNNNSSTNIFTTTNTRRRSITALQLQQPQPTYNYPTINPLRPRTTRLPSPSFSPEPRKIGNQHHQQQPSLESSAKNPNMSQKKDEREVASLMKEEEEEDEDGLSAQGRKNSSRQPNATTATSNSHSPFLQQNHHRQQSSENNDQSKKRARSFSDVDPSEGKVALWIEAKVRGLFFSGDDGTNNRQLLMSPPKSARNINNNDEVEEDVAAMAKPTSSKSPEIRPRLLTKSIYEVEEEQKQKHVKILQNLASIRLITDDSFFDSLLPKHTIVGYFTLNGKEDGNEKQQQQEENISFLPKSFIHNHHHSQGPINSGGNNNSDSLSPLRKFIIANNDASLSPGHNHYYGNDNAKTAANLKQAILFNTSPNSFEVDHDEDEILSKIAKHQRRKKRQTCAVELPKSVGGNGILKSALTMIYLREKSRKNKQQEDEIMKRKGAVKKLKSSSSSSSSAFTSTSEDDEEKEKDEEAMSLQNLIESFSKLQNNNNSSSHSDESSLLELVDVASSSIISGLPPLVELHPLVDDGQNNDETQNENKCSLFHPVDDEEEKHDRANRKVENDSSDDADDAEYFRVRKNEIEFLNHEHQNAKQESGETRPAEKNNHDDNAIQIFAIVDVDKLKLRRAKTAKNINWPCSCLPQISYDTLQPFAILVTVRNDNNGSKNTSSAKTALTVRNYLEKSKQLSDWAKLELSKIVEKEELRNKNHVSNEDALRKELEEKIARDVSRKDRESKERQDKKENKKRLSPIDENSPKTFPDNNDGSSIRLPEDKVAADRVHRRENKKNIGNSENNQGKNVGDGATSSANDRRNNNDNTDSKNSFPVPSPSPEPHYQEMHPHVAALHQQNKIQNHQKQQQQHINQTPRDENLQNHHHQPQIHKDPEVVVVVGRNLNQNNNNQQHPIVSQPHQEYDHYVVAIQNGKVSYQKKSTSPLNQQQRNNNNIDENKNDILDDIEAELKKSDEIQQKQQKQNEKPVIVKIEPKNGSRANTPLNYPLNHTNNNHHQQARSTPTQNDSNFYKNSKNPSVANNNNNLVASMIPLHPTAFAPKFREESTTNSRNNNLHVNITPRVVSRTVTPIENNNNNNNIPLKTPLNEILPRSVAYPGHHSSHQQKNQINDIIDNNNEKKTTDTTTTLTNPRPSQHVVQHFSQQVQKPILVNSMTLSSSPTVGSLLRQPLPLNNNNNNNNNFAGIMKRSSVSLSSNNNNQQQQQQKRKSTPPLIVTARDEKQILAERLSRQPSTASLNKLVNGNYQNNMKPSAVAEGDKNRNEIDDDI